MEVERCHKIYAIGLAEGDGNKGNMMFKVFPPRRFLVHLKIEKSYYQTMFSFLVYRRSCVDDKRRQASPKTSLSWRKMNSIYEIAESEAWEEKIIRWLYCYDQVFINLHLNINEKIPSAD